MASVAPQGRLACWARAHVPTREAIERNRWLRPVAHRLLAPSLWRLNRRSVPRAIGVGLFSGIIFPFAHMGLAALLSVPLRANVPTAVGTTLVNNPVTFVPIMCAAWKVGRWVLHLDHVVTGTPVRHQSGWLHWIVAHGGPAIVGMAVLAVAAGLIGYAAATLAWRWRTVRRWRTRRAVTR
jgi:uncharacterized protein